jgi:hypothetical protein
MQEIQRGDPDSYTYIFTTDLWKLVRFGSVLKSPLSCMAMKAFGEKSEVL